MDNPQPVKAPHMTTPIRHRYTEASIRLAIILVSGVLSTSACTDSGALVQNNPQSSLEDTGNSAIDEASNNQINNENIDPGLESPLNAPGTELSQTTYNEPGNFTINLSNYSELLSKGLELTRGKTIMSLIDQLKHEGITWDTSWKYLSEDNVEVIETELCELGGQVTRKYSKASDLSANYHSTLLFENCAFGEYNITGTGSLLKELLHAGHGTTQNSFYEFQKLEITKHSGQVHEFTGTVKLKASATGFTNHYILENRIDRHTIRQGADQVLSISNSIYKQQLYYLLNYTSEESADKGSYFTEQGSANQVVAGADKHFSLSIEPALEYQVINNGSTTQQYTHNLERGSVTLESTQESADGSKLSVTTLDGDTVVYSITQWQDEYRIEDSWLFGTTCRSHEIFNLWEC